MKLSTRGRYATRAMIELAREYGRGSVSIDRVAEQQHISKRYLEHIFARLREAGLVSGTRGSKGGYTLRLPPSKITVGQVVRAVEGPLGPVHCVDRPDSCPRTKNCATHDLWKKAAVVLNRLLDRYTIESLLRDQQRLEAAGGKER